jgi:phosphatidylserine/phosphatidylglycerophosphate/cardiolipin synthase-like enzyme
MFPWQNRAAKPFDLGCYQFPVWGKIRQRRRYAIGLRQGLLGIIGIVLSLVACHPQQTQVSPLPQDPLIQVYFNHSEASTYQEPYRSLQQPRAGDNLEQLLIDTIEAATTTIDLAVLELGLPKVAQALVDRHRAGVQVRVILDNDYSRPLSEFTAAEIAQLPKREQARHQEFLQLVDRDGDGNLSGTEIAQGDPLVMLQQAGIPIVDDTADGSKGSGLMHHKFLVVDGKIVVTGSANFTTSDIHGDFSNPDSRGNANHLLRIESAALAHLFTEEFNLLWGDGPGGQPNSRFGVRKPARPAQTLKVGNIPVTIHFSPDSTTQTWSATSNGLIGATLEQAQKEVNLALFVFSEQRFADILQTRHQQGVEVRVLIDSSFAFRSYSEGLDLLGVALTNKCKYESGNNPWPNPVTTVGTPQLPPGDLLHHKFAVIDGRTVITGSHNWSESANRQNDETLLVIQSSTIAAHFDREFKRLYQDAVLGIPPRVQQKIAQDQQKCF